MAGRVSGKTILITGSAAGLGREYALTFAREGAADLILADINEAGLAESKAMVEAAGSRASVHRVDMASESDIVAFRQGGTRRA